MRRYSKFPVSGFYVLFLKPTSLYHSQLNWYWIVILCSTFLIPSIFVTHYLFLATMGSSKSKETVRTLCFNLGSEQGKGNDRFIALENFSIHGRKVTGIVSMKNFDQSEDKWEVKVRFTLNSWDSYNDKTCECIEDIGKTKMDGIKRFKFEIKVPIGNSLEYAIFCRNAESEIWDNNEYKNYTFSE